MKDTSECGKRMSARFGWPILVVVLQLGIAVLAFLALPFLGMRVGPWVTPKELAAKQMWDREKQEYRDRVARETAQESVRNLLIFDQASSAFSYPCYLIKHCS